jgi:hypothetical protein
MTTYFRIESLSNATDLFPAGGSGEVYVLPDIWSSDNPEIACQFPCTFVLPPYPLSTTSTVTWPDYITSFLVSASGTVSTTTTTIPVTPFPVTSVPFWPVTVVSNNNTSGVLIPEPSVAPPSFVIDLPGSVTPFPVTSTNYTVIAMGQTASGTTTGSPTTATTGVTTPTPFPADMEDGCTQFHLVQSGDSCWSIETSYDIAASDFEAWNPDVGTGCASGVWLNYYYCVSHTVTSPSASQSGATATFGSSSHHVTIQLQPTVDSAAPSITITPITVKNGKPEDVSSSDQNCDGCGSLECSLFGCDGKCGIFGCDGGCGVWWCGGGCSLEFCGPGCGDGKLSLSLCLNCPVLTQGEI